MKRVIVLATLLIAGALSLAVTASQQPVAGCGRAGGGAEGRRGRETPRQPVYAEGRGR